MNNIVCTVVLKVIYRRAFYLASPVKVPHELCVCRNSADRFGRQGGCSLRPPWFSYPVNHAYVLLGAAEVFGDVGDAERLVLTRVNPSLVLRRPGDPVEEDPEGLPHSLLTDWPNTHTHTTQAFRLWALNTLLIETSPTQEQSALHCKPQWESVAGSVFSTFFVSYCRLVFLHITSSRVNC